LSTYLIHVAGFNLVILMRAMFGKGNPEGGREHQKRDLVHHSNRFCVGDRRHLGHRGRNGKCSSSSSSLMRLDQKATSSPD